MSLSLRLPLFVGVVGFSCLGYTAALAAKSLIHMVQDMRLRERQRMSLRAYLQQLEDVER